LAHLHHARREPDAAETNHCGTCQNCLDICPTKAFPAPYQLDARRCISYLTIEHKGHIAAEFRDSIGNRIYGCDDCLAVCPWNKFAVNAREAAFHPRAELMSPLLAELANLDDAKFRELFKGSPVKRIGRDRFVRNVLMAIGNSGDGNLGNRRSACDRRFASGARDGGVGVVEIAPEEEFALRRTYAAAETDSAVAEDGARDLRPTCCHRRNGSSSRRGHKRLDAVSCGSPAGLSGAWTSLRPSARAPARLPSSTRMLPLDKGFRKRRVERKRRGDVASIAERPVP
jgi:ferredoxin